MDSRNQLFGLFKDDLGSPRLHIHLKFIVACLTRFEGVSVKAAELDFNFSGFYELRSELGQHARML